MTGAFFSLFVVFTSLFGGVSHQAHATIYERAVATSSYYVTEVGDEEGNSTITIDAGHVDATHTASGSGASSQRLVALTFDDGPRASSTEKVLAILMEEHVPGTFFLIGQNIERYPKLAREIVKQGHVVGIHTYDHPKNLPWMNTEKREWELNYTRDLIASTTGVYTTLFRPPYGIMTSQYRRYLEGQGYSVLMWNVDPEDWDYRHATAEKMTQSILSHTKNRMIILFHDGRDSSGIHNNLEESLPNIIKGLKEKGYTFVTIDKI